MCKTTAQYCCKCGGVMHTAPELMYDDADKRTAFTRLAYVCPHCGYECEGEAHRTEDAPRKVYGPRAANPGPGQVVRAS